MMLTGSERLALLVALDKRVKPALGDAKDAARQSLIEAQAQDGTDRRAIMVGGVKVGEVGVSYSKPCPCISPERMDDAIAFLSELGLVDMTPKRGWESHFSCVAGKRRLHRHRRDGRLGDVGAVSRQVRERARLRPRRRRGRVRRQAIRGHADDALGRGRVMGRHDEIPRCRRCGVETPSDDPFGRLGVQVTREALVTNPWRGEHYARQTRMVGPTARLCPDCAADAQEMIERWCEEGKHDGDTDR